MTKRSTWVTALALLAMSAGASAGESTGIYTTHDEKSMEAPLPDGGRTIVSHYYQLTKSEKADDPINDTESFCVGRFIVSKDGKVTAASGFCLSENASRDGSSWWWKADEIGTTGCPDMCGSFGYVEGYGKLKGVTGGGTWVRTAVLTHGSMGTFKSNYSIK